MTEVAKLRARYMQLCAELGDIVIRQKRDAARIGEIETAVAGLNVMMAIAEAADKATNDAASGAPPEGAPG